MASPLKKIDKMVQYIIFQLFDMPTHYYHLCQQQVSLCFGGIKIFIDFLQWVRCKAPQARHPLCSTVRDAQGLFLSLTHVPIVKSGKDGTFHSILILITIEEVFKYFY